tara:strand:+ start:290 stop:469 length:180 start_codon:yes stop_codon:yes gene_type:complete
MDNIIFSNAKYNEVNGELVGIYATVNEESVVLPIDPANRYYAEIMRQVDAGELTIADAD